MESQTKKQKMEELLDYSCHKSERSTVCRYIRALRSSNQEQINYFEQFGERVSQILLNVRTYEQALKCGFDASIKLNEYGWVEESYRLKKFEVIEIESGEKYLRNLIDIAQLPNEKFVYGTSYCTGGAGGSYGPSIWADQFDTFKDALKSAIEELENRYAYAKSQGKTDTCNFNSKMVNCLITHLAEVKAKYFGVVQLSLF